MQAGTAVWNGFSQRTVANPEILDLRSTWPRWKKPSAFAPIAVNECSQPLIFKIITVTVCILSIACPGTLSIS